MAPYNPPIAHYNEVDVSKYDEDTMYGFIGKEGHRFYWLTRFLGLDYLWYDEGRKVVEIWGSYESHLLGQTKNIIMCELEHFCQNRTQVE